MTLHVGNADLTGLAALLAGESLLWLGGLGWTSAMALHAGLVVACWCLAEAAGRPLWQLGAVLTLGAGPFGAAVGIVLALGLRLVRLEPDGNADWYHLLSGSRHDKLQRSLAMDLLAGRVLAYRVPQRDLPSIFATGNRLEKRTALRWLAQRESGDFAAELRQALNDDDPAIRIEAAAVLGRLQ